MTDTEIGRLEHKIDELYEKIEGLFYQETSPIASLRRRVTVLETFAFFGKWFLTPLVAMIWVAFLYWIRHSL